MGARGRGLQEAGVFPAPSCISRAEEGALKTSAVRQILRCDLLARISLHLLKTLDMGQSWHWTSLSQQSRAQLHSVMVPHDLSSQAASEAGFLSNMCHPCPRG